MEIFAKILGIIISISAFGFLVSWGVQSKVNPYILTILVLLIAFYLFYLSKNATDGEGIQFFISLFSSTFGAMLIFFWIFTIVCIGPRDNEIISSISESKKNMIEYECDSILYFYLKEAFEENNIIVTDTTSNSEKTARVIEDVCKDIFRNNVDNVHYWERDSIKLYKYFYLKSWNAHKNHYIGHEGKLDCPPDDHSGCSYDTIPTRSAFRQYKFLCC